MERKINLQIEYQCPQCGAPATLEETDRLFTCQYCKVKSYLMQKDYFRFMLPHKAPSGEELIYFPYWRFKGLLFACVTKGVTNKFMDASHQAVASNLFPASVGLRSQALKLQFVTPETPGRFINPTLSLQEVLDIFDSRYTNSLGGPVYTHANIGETVSLIYSPFYLKKKMFDAVLNQAVSEPLEDDSAVMALEGGAPTWRMRFMPTLCPHCGWDLEGERESLVLLCQNCNSVWMPLKSKLKKISFAHIPSQSDNAIFLPFWRIEADISGIQLDSYADMIKLANLPLAVQPQFHEERFHFYALAFKVRPRVFVRLANNITLAQPRDKMVDTIPQGQLHPVSLPLSEAAESLIINLAGFVKPPKSIYPQLDEIQIKPRHFRLVYVPFEVHHHEFIQPDYRLTVNKNMLALSRNL